MGTRMDWKPPSGTLIPKQDAVGERTRSASGKNGLTTYFKTLRTFDGKLNNHHSEKGK